MKNMEIKGGSRSQVGKKKYKAARVTGPLHPLSHLSQHLKKTFVHPPPPKSVTHTHTYETKKNMSKTIRCRSHHHLNNQCPCSQINFYISNYSHSFSNTQKKEWIKRNRSPEDPDLSEKKRKQVKPPYLPGEDVCRISREQVERVFAQTRCPKDLNCLRNFRQVNGKDIEIPGNFLRVKRLLTVVRSGQGTGQIWGMIEESNTTLKLPPVVYLYDVHITKMSQFCSGRLPFFVQHIPLQGFKVNASR